ncbi:MAG TPA: hypothetical protein VKQ71_06160, partial [Acidimicrobiales bacterium]|nr:hypothetical protein [Acidimicrobiales bacterium]
MTGFGGWPGRSYGPPPGGAGSRVPDAGLATHPGGPLEVAGMWAGAILVAAAVVVWMTGELAGRLWGRRWRTVGPGDIGEVLIRLPSHLADPGRAWLPPASGVLPGP